jgi:hypothetical protein
MKKTIIALSVLTLILFGGINTSRAGVPPGYYWSAVRTIVQGIRSTAALIDAATALKGLSLPVGFQFDMTIPTVITYDGFAIEVTAGSTYDKNLIIWLLWGSTWERAIEMQYNDVNKGEIIIKPYAFTHTGSSTAMHKIVYNHTTGTREMTVYSNPASVTNIDKSICIAKEEGGYVTVYFTANLNTTLGGTPTSDVYLFGAKISTTSPYPCTALQGIKDIGDTPYNFTFYGATYSYNAGLFNSIDGYVAQGQTGGTYGSYTYPLASEIDPANLPTDTDLIGLSTISFAATGDPSWIKTP